MKLIIEDDEGRKTVVPIVRDDVEITIGRQEGNTIRLTERNISRKHAKLIRRGGMVFVEDLGSYNGVKINGERISGTGEVCEGDLVQIGDYDLAIQSEGARAAAPSPAKPQPAHAQAEQEEEPEFDLAPEAEAEPEAEDEPARPAHRRESTAVISPAQLKATRSSRKVVEIPAGEAPRLVLTSGENIGQEFACIRSELKIGRTEDNDIAIDHRSLSRNHCKIVREDDGEWKVVDLQSSNGVKVNGESYAVSALHPGDVLELGHIKFQFIRAGDKSPVAGSSSSGKGRLLLVMGTVAALALLGAAAFFLTRGKPVTPADPAAVAATDAPDTAAPPAPTEPPAAVVEAPPPVEPAVDLPPPDPKAVKALEDGRRLLAAGKFAEAEKKLGLAKDADVPEAAELLEQARAELEAQANLLAAQKKYAARDYEGAMFAASEIPPESTLALKARELEARIEAAQNKDEQARQAAADRAAKAEDERRLKAEQARAATDRVKATPEPAKTAPDKPAADSAASAIRKQAAADLETGKLLANRNEPKYDREAIPYLERALKADPSLTEAHVYLGTCYARLKEARRGAYHYEEFVHLHPNDPQAKSIRAILRSYFQDAGERPRWPLGDD